MCVCICFHKYLYMHTDTDFSCPPRYFCWSLKFQKHKRCKENFSVLHPKCMYLVHWLLLWFFGFFLFTHPSLPTPSSSLYRISATPKIIFLRKWSLFSLLERYVWCRGFRGFGVVFANLAWFLLLFVCFKENLVNETLQF